MNNLWMFWAILKPDRGLIKLVKKSIWSNIYDFHCQYSKYCFIKFAESIKDLFTNESEAFKQLHSDHNQARL